MEAIVSNYPEGFYGESFLELTWGAGNPDLYTYLGPTVSTKPIEHNIRNSYDISKRIRLSESFLAQYQGIDLSEKQIFNIEQLKLENAFTVTTGQQIHVGLGPMYVWNKIMSVLNTIDVLSMQNPSNHYIPVFWMATEDHDFEEIRDVKIFGQSFRWETDQQGPVGMFHTQELTSLFEQIRKTLNLNEEALLRLQTIESLYRGSQNLSEATRKLIQIIFSDKGLLVFDPNDTSLKKESVHIWKKDLLIDGNPENQSGIKSIELLKKQHELMLSQGVEPQAFPREINCFYIEEGIRERIEYQNGKYVRIQSKIRYSQEEMDYLIENQSDKISPNVLLRPIYQQNILPNVVYIGGPAEIKYWIQIAPLFEHHGVVMPRLQLRLSSLILNQGGKKKIEKLGLLKTDFWKPFSEIEGKIIDIQDEKYTLDFEIEQLAKTYEGIWKSLFNMNFEGLKALKKNHTESIKELRRISQDHKNHPDASSKLSKDLNTAKQLKTQYFDTQKPQERLMHWIEWYVNQNESLPILETDLPIQFIEFTA